MTHIAEMTSPQLPVLGVSYMQQTSCWDILNCLGPVERRQNQSKVLVCQNGTEAHS